MDISIFEIIGPVMIGPSSSHTAGMARIGRMAHEMMGRLVPEAIELTLHPALRYTYRGHRTDVALIGGLLGIREDDEKIRDAKEIIRSQNIGLTVDFWQDRSVNPNTVRITAQDREGRRMAVKGISIGGGSMVVTGIDDFNVSISGSEHHILIWADADVGGRIEAAAGLRPVKSECRGKYLFLLSMSGEPDNALCSVLADIAGVSRVNPIAPVLSYGFRAGSKPLFTSCGELLALAQKERKSIPELAVGYEMNRSGKSREEILSRMHDTLRVMREACRKGMEDDITLNFGLTSGRDGKMLYSAVRAGKTLSGNPVALSIARAIGTMEVNGSMGCVVAAPTAGSSGIVPGCFITMQQERGYSDEQLVGALLTAAAMGVVMHFRNASFSGVVGGCQGEVGVSSAIAAAGLVFLGGGDGEDIVHGMALSMKNLLGLICDPIAGPVEVPCIKRNAVGVANAYAAADMALAGIRSYIPPDEVIEALVNTQRLLPPELKGTTTGGLACTKTARALREELEKQG